MTLFAELDKVARNFGAIGTIDSVTDLDSVMELCAQALRFVQNAEDLFRNEDVSELEVVRAVALELQHTVRQLQVARMSGSALDISGVAKLYEDLRLSCRSICAAHNCILVDWWDLATHHA